MLISANNFGEETHKAALKISLRILDSLLAMEAIEAKLIVDEDKARSETEAKRREDKSLAIPAIGEIDARIRAFIQNAERCCQELYNIGCLCYEVKKGWVDGLLKEMRERHSEALQPVVEELASLSKFMKFVRNARNCVEHSRADQKIAANDFRLTKDVLLAGPSIEVVHAETPEPEVPLRNFMIDVNTSVLNVVERFIACIAALHIKPSAFPIDITIIPEEKRRNRLVRFGYVIAINGEWHPMS